MRSLFEVLGKEGILPSEFDLWERIRQAKLAADWIDPDPLEQMTFAVATEDQKKAARARIGNAIQVACDTLGLARDYPAIDDGQPVPPAPDGTRYYQDWYNDISARVKSAQGANATPVK